MYEAWHDSNRDIVIEPLDSSLLKITMFDIDRKEYDTAYLSKSDIRSLIRYLREQERKMCWLSYVPEGEK